MGYNTAIMILNDGADQLLKDPDAAAKIHRKIGGHLREPATVSLGNHANPVMVLPSQHADQTQIIAIGGNHMRNVTTLYIWNFGPNDEKLKLEIMRQLANELGYDVHRKRKGIVTL